MAQNGAIFRPPNEEAVNVERGETARCYVSYSSPEALFRAEYRNLVRVLTVVAGDQDAAAEAVQEGFVQLCVKWPQIRSYEDQRGWLRRVSLNRLKNRRRALARRTAALLRWSASADSSVCPPDPTRMDLARALRSLPPKQRTAMALYYVGDLTIVDVADAMGVSEGTVNRHLHRGREAVRHYLEVI